MASSAAAVDGNKPASSSLITQLHLPPGHQVGPYPFKYVSSKLTPDEKTRISFHKTLNPQPYIPNLSQLPPLQRLTARKQIKI